MTDPPKAVSECFKALEHLGEPLAVGVDIDVRDACDELRKCRDQFGEKRRKFVAARRLAEKDNRAMAMKIMTSLMLLSQRMQAHIGAYCSCQIIRMTLNYGRHLLWIARSSSRGRQTHHSVLFFSGHCEHSVVGAAAFAACLARHLGDVDEATEWGNTTLSLLKLYNREKLLPSVFPPLYGSVFIWKRPIHASLDFLAEGVRASFGSRDADSTGQITIHYLVRSLNCGKNIGVLKKEVEALARQLSSYFGKAISPLLQLWLTPIFIMLRGLEGTSGEPSSFPLDPNQLRSNDAIMQAVLEKKNDLCFVSILCHQTSNALHFRKMDKALEYADVFYEQYLVSGDVCLCSRANSRHDTTLELIVLRLTIHIHHRPKAWTKSIPPSTTCFTKASLPSISCGRRVRVESMCIPDFSSILTFSTISLQEEIITRNEAKTL